MRVFRSVKVIERFGLYVAHPLVSIRNLNGAHPSGRTSLERILARHVVVNLLSPVIVQATFTFAFSIMEVVALNFLGVGIPHFIPNWGGMMSEATNYILVAPWMIGFPGLFLAMSVLSFNSIGDAFRDRLDPKLRTEQLA